MEYITYAVKEDVEKIEEIMKNGLAATECKDWYVTDDREFIERHIEAEGYILKYVVVDNIAGFLLVRHPGGDEDNLGRCLENWNEELLCKVAHMESAAVLPMFRGRKIQKKLLEEAEKIEQKRGTEYLMGTVHPDNVYSADNLAGCGFECLMETEKYGGLRRKIMCKKLL